MLSREVATLVVAPTLVPAPKIISRYLLKLVNSLEPATENPSRDPDQPRTEGGQPVRTDPGLTDQTGEGLQQFPNRFSSPGFPLVARPDQEDRFPSRERDQILDFLFLDN